MHLIREPATATLVRRLRRWADGRGGATAVGPSIATLREHPELVDRAAAQGRAMYCWTVDHFEDVEFCRDVGVGWIATNHPGRTKAWLHNGLTGPPRDDQAATQEPR
jgi:glycerophosphoryl diester phosphodiesterase